MKTRQRALGVVALFLCALSLDGGAEKGNKRYLPERVLQKLYRSVPTPYDQPAAAHAFFYEKRLSDVPAVDPRREYERARQHMRSMRRHSTRRQRLLASQAAGTKAAATPTHLDRWEALGPGNIGGRTRVMLIDPRAPRRMYAAGVSGGIWKTTNRGKRWRPVGDEMANLAVNALAFDPADPDTLYAGTGEGFFREEVRATSLPLRGGGIFVSHDRGESWSFLASTAGRRFDWVNDLVVSPHDSSRIYAATRAGVLRSKDRGESWKRVLRTRVKGGCLDLALRTDAETDFLFASCGTLETATVYRKPRAEGGGKWTPVLSEDGMGRTSLAIAPSNQDIIYALAASNVPGTEGLYEQSLHAVFRSDEGGATGSWEATVHNSDPRKINTLLLSNPITASVEECDFEESNRVFGMGWYVNVIAVDPGDPERVWAAGVDLFRSDDGGREWNPATYWWAERGESSFVHADHHGLVFHPRKRRTLYSLNDGGVYRTTNATAGLSHDDLAVCDPGSVAVRWKSLNNRYGVTQFYHGSVFPDGEHVLGGTQDNGTISNRFSVGGQKWQRVFGGDGGYSAIASDDEHVVYVTTQNGLIHKSTDGGANFSSAIDGINDLGGPGDFHAVATNYLFIAPLIMDPSDSATLWFGGRRIWRTSDAAASWRPASTRLADGGKTSAIAVSPLSGEIVAVGTNRGTIYTTRDGANAGATTVWQGVRPRSGFVSSVVFDPLDSAVLFATYAGFGGEHVWKSLDGGVTWLAIDGQGSSGLPNIPVHSVVVDLEGRDDLYVGTDLGVFASLDGGETWTIEITGFARAVTEWLALGQSPTGRRHLFAFTHGRGAWRVPLE
ncbi:MAG: hypothetical protein OES47_04680 [Acidobacteriota bacterium]|nr:hypothetical protein [Acidobacteriota bacterium]